MKKRISIFILAIIILYALFPIEIYATSESKKATGTITGLPTGITSRWNEF